MPDALRFLCQRAPAISHSLVFFVTLFGSSYASPLYYAMYIALHTMMLVATCQVFWGTWAAVMGTRKQEQGSWRREWASKKLRDVESGGEHDFFPGDVEHVIIIPNYNEEIQVLMETLDCLASHPASRYQYRVVLAMEAREEGSEIKAIFLLKHYEQHFKAILSTRHPDRIPGEAKGKASNVNWGAREVAASSSTSFRARQIVTVMDSDILIAADYFEAAAIRFVQADAEERTKMMFVLPLVFDRNADQVPRGVRVTDVTWATAGMSSIYPGSMIKIPTSAYSVTMDLATRIGFWDVGPEGIGEDFHMFCKSFLSTGGQLISHTIYSPASVTNVVGAYHGQGFRGWHTDLQARYQQAVRHLWGSLDTGYVLRRLITMSSVEGSVTPSTFSEETETPSSDSGFETTNDDYLVLPEEALVPLSSSKALPFDLHHNWNHDFTPRVPLLQWVALLCKCYQAHSMLPHLFIVLTMEHLTSTGAVPLASSYEGFCAISSDCLLTRFDPADLSGIGQTMCDIYGRIQCVNLSYYVLEARVFETRSDALGRFNNLWIPMLSLLPKAQC